jgi:hypothetical protein
MPVGARSSQNAQPDKPNDNTSSKAAPPRTVVVPPTLELSNPYRFPSAHISLLETLVDSQRRDPHPTTC